MSGPPTASTCEIRYSVIVPAYNAAQTIGDCLQALLSQSVSSDLYEVIVVDDGSADATAEVAARFGVSVLRQPHAGPAAARNTGARAARGAYLLFTDADCTPIPTWISSIVEPLACSAGIGGVKGTCLTQQTGLIARFTQVEMDEKTAWQRRHRFIDFVDTSSAAFRRTAFDAVGGFDESLTAASNEDTLLAFGLAERGWQLVLVPDAIVYHRHAEALTRYLVRKWRHGFWRIRVYERHPRKVLGDSYTPPALQAQFAATVVLLATLPFSRLRCVARLAALLFLVMTYPFVRRAARRGWNVAALTPGLLLLRALALGTGLGCGLVGAIIAAAIRWLGRGPS